MYKKYFSFFSLFLISLALSGADVTFKASAPSAVTIGQQFRVTYVVNGDAKEFRAPEFTGFDVLMGPTKSTSSSTSYVNGKMTSDYSVTYTYILMGKSEGAFSIPEAHAMVGGGRYTSNTLSVKVVKQDKSDQEAGQQEGASGASNGAITNDNIYIKLALSKSTVYEQEYILATFKLYSKYDISGFEKVQFPEFEGFLTQEIELPQDKQWDLETVGESVFRTVVLKQTLLFPQRTGDLKIPVGTFDAVIKVRNQQQSRSVFDSFFDSYVDVRKTLKTNPATIKVLDLPSGKPGSFSGSVGSFNLKSSITTQSIKANEAVTIKVDISGNGNLKLMKNPEIKFPADFEVYDPKVDVKMQTSASGVNGTKSIEYLVVPRFAGDFVIPATEFSYFNPQKKAYETLTIPEYKLHVEKGSGAEGSATGVVNNFSNRESVKHLGSDIRFIKTDNAVLKRRDAFIAGSLSYWLAYLLPLLAFAILFYIYRKQIKENANIALVKTKKANKVATKRLKQAQQYLKENKKEQYYEEISKALWGYLSDKLSIPIAYLTKDNVEQELNNNSVPQELIRNIMHILDTCEFARYAPSQVSETMDQLYAESAEAIGNMENTIIKKK